MRETVAATKALFAITEAKDDAADPSLDEFQRDYIQNDITFVYPVVRYDNPEFFPGNISIQVNFQPRSRDHNVANYLVDSGRRFRRNGIIKYGWRSVQSGTGVTITDRSFGLVDQNVDPSFQPFLSAIGFTNEDNLEAAKWEIEVPNGRYKVSVGVGDLDPAPGTLNIINIEDQEVLKFVPNVFNRNSEGNLTVDVIDGFLTLDSVGGTFAKISWTKIDVAD